MTLYLYLSIFLAALFISLVMTPWVCEMAVAVGLVVPPSSRRHLHTAALPRLGGMAIFVAFAVALGLALPVARWSHVVLPLHLLVGILLPALLIFLLGIYDDLRSLSAKTKLAVQSIAAASLSFSGLGIRTFNFVVGGGHLLARAVDLGLTVFWVLLITNAFNLIDGLDGLAAGSALVTAGAIFLISLYLHNIVVAVVVTALAGALLGFLPSNFYPANIFMGDSGSLLIGFLLSAVALAGPHARGVLSGAFIPLLVCGLPILDVTLAVARRSLRGKSPFHPDAEHIHHKLLKRGLPQDRTALTLYAITALFGCASLLLVWHQAWMLEVLVGVVVIACLGVRQLQYAEFSPFLSPWLPQLWPEAPASAENSEKVRISNATQFLTSTADFRAIQVILREALEPAGFDGVRLDMDSIHFGGALPEALSYDERGQLTLMWSKWGSDSPRGETKFTEVEFALLPGIGHLCLVGTGTATELTQEAAKLPERFKWALSDAILRAVNRARRSQSVPPAAVTAHASSRLTEEMTSD
jgi:UDP-GlcNAc:undecaprenyl-phosphate/decaprenyl-phosphate GlcNAc-1-phosphate transferase